MAFPIQTSNHGIKCKAKSLSLTWMRQYLWGYTD